MKPVAMFLFLFFFMLIFIAVMVGVVFSMIEGMDDAGAPIWTFVLPGLIFFFVFCVIIYAIFSNLFGLRKSKRTVHTDQTYIKQDPMSYERMAPLNYCRFCGANLGTSDPAVCPECRNKLKDDFYH